MVDYGSHILLANVLFHGTMSHLRTRGPANLGSLLVLILLQQLGVAWSRTQPTYTGMGPGNKTVICYEFLSN